MRKFKKFFDWTLLLIIKKVSNLLTMKWGFVLRAPTTLAYLRVEYFEGRDVISWISKWDYWFCFTVRINPPVWRVTVNDMDHMMKCCCEKQEEIRRTRLNSRALLLKYIPTTQSKIWIPSFLKVVSGETKKFYIFRWGNYSKVSKFYVLILTILRKEGGNYSREDND